MSLSERREMIRKDNTEGPLCLACCQGRKDQRHTRTIVNVVGRD